MWAIKYAINMLLFIFDRQLSIYLIEDWLAAVRTHCPLSGAVIREDVAAIKWP